MLGKNMLNECINYRSRIVIFIFFLTTLSACSTLASYTSFGLSSKVKTITIQAKASHDVNADSNGQPAPLVLYLYQLTDDQGFINNDFFALYQKPKEVLGNEYLCRKEMVITPNGKLNETCSLNANAKYLGILAIYRNLDTTNWRLTLPTSKVASKKSIVLNLTQGGINIEEPTLG